MYFFWRYSQNTHKDSGIFNDMSSTEEQANAYILKLTCCFSSSILVIKITGQVEREKLQETYFFVSVFRYCSFTQTSLYVLEFRPNIKNWMDI